EGVVEPGGEGGRVPAAGAAALEGDRGAARRVRLEQPFELQVAGFCVDARRDAQGELESRGGAQHVAGRLDRRQAAGARDGEGGAPGGGEALLDGVCREGPGGAGPGELGGEGAAAASAARLERAGGDAGLGDAG